MASSVKRFGKYAKILHTTGGPVQGTHVILSNDQPLKAPYGNDGCECNKTGVVTLKHDDYNII